MLKAFRRATIQGAAVLLLAGAITPSLAQTTHRFDLPPQRLDKALNAFAAQAGINIYFDPADVRGKLAPKLTTQATADDALAMLLAGTDLKTVYVDERTIRVVAKDKLVSETSSLATAGQALDASPNERASWRTIRLAQSDGGTGPQASSAAEAPVAESVQEIIVTGSRIRRAEGESNNPLTVVDRQQLESYSTSNLIDIINRNPQASLGGDLQVDTTGAGFKNAGLSTVNLRGLGDNRTLTLVNGRRQVAGSSGSSAVDLNTIAATSLERVEIVTGGSSSVYGADAIAGVVNLITRQNFSGATAEAQVGFTEEGGGATRHFATTLGHNFADDRANIMFSLTHDEERPIFTVQRDYYYAPEGVPGTYGYAPNPLRTATNVTVPRLVPMLGLTGITYRRYGNPVVTTPIGGNAAYSFSFDDTGNLVPFDAGTRLVDGAGRLQSNSVNCPDCWTGLEFGIIRNSLERTGGELQGRYELLSDGDGLFESAEAFVEAKHYAVDSNTRRGFSTFAGAGLSSVRLGGYAISIENPYAPAALIDLMTANGLDHVDVTRINNDLGQDVNALKAAYAGSDPLRTPGAMLDLSSEFRLQRYVTGLRGTFGNDWNFELYGNYGKTRSEFVNTDSLDSMFRQQVDAVVDPGSGEIVCRSTLTNPDNGCIPINIMQIGSASPEAVAYSFRRPVQKDSITQRNAVATVDGSLFSWPSLWSGAELPVGFAAGVEYRRESSEAIPDEYGLSGDLVFLGKKVATVGHYSSWEAFGELNAPLLRDVPFAQSLEISASYRYQDYTTTGSDGSYGFSTNWAPLSAIKFRGSFARAVRAPNVNELFSGTNSSLLGVIDPCDVSQVNSGPAPANRRANCQALLGDAAANFVQSPSRKFVVLQGNRDLDAETADTVTLGVVLTPGFVPNLMFTADYYRIEIEDVITSLAANQIVDNCVDSPSLGNDFCASVTRDAGGDISTVIQQVFNLARYQTHGWDFGAAYRTPLAGGQLALQANATHLLELVYDPVPSNPSLQTRLDRIAPNPTWRANVNTGFATGPLSVNWNIRYLGSVIRNWNDVIGDYSMSEAHPESGSYVQHDLRLGYLFGKQQLYVGVDNLFDEHAPMTPFTYQHPMYPRIGRNFYAGIKASF